MRTPLPSWRNLDIRTKIIIAQDAVASNNNAYTFTVNLDHPVKEKAWASKKGLKDYISHRVNKRLKQVADRVGHSFIYWFVLEISPADVLHIHGIFVANDNELPLIEAAFRSIAGPYAIEPETRPGRHAVHIAKHNSAKNFRGFRGALGWGAYALKQISKTERAIGQCPVVMSHPMNRIAHDHWEAITSGGGGVDAFVPSATASAALLRKSLAPIGSIMAAPVAQDSSTSLLRPSNSIMTASAATEECQRPASPPRRALPKSSRPCPLPPSRSRSRSNPELSPILRRLDAVQRKQGKLRWFREVGQINRTDVEEPGGSCLPPGPFKTRELPNGRGKHPQAPVALIAADSLSRGAQSLSLGRTARRSKSASLCLCSTSSAPPPASAERGQWS